MEKELEPRSHTLLLCLTKLTYHESGIKLLCDTVGREKNDENQMARAGVFLDYHR